LSVLSKRLAALEASLPPPPSQYAVADYCRGDDGFAAALAEIVEKDRGKPGGITDQDEVFSISIIKGLPGQGEDLTIIRIAVDLNAYARAPEVAARLIGHEPDGFRLKDASGNDLSVYSLGAIRGR
jgi:hypothetical protein